jgi:hypothetical protein
MGVDNMQRFPAKILSLLVFVAITACKSQPNQLILPVNINELVQDNSKLPVEVTAHGSVNCPILKSGKWYAWLDKFTKKDGQYRLNINGEVIMPTPGFAMQWSVGPTDRMQPPSLRLSLLPKASNLMVIQVLTKVPVKYSLETPISEFSSISIFCGEKLLSRIEGVTLTD